MPEHRGYVRAHVLDTARGVGAAGLRIDIDIERPGNDHPSWSRVKTVTTGADGRSAQPLVDACVPGTYQLTFHVADYFAENGVSEAANAHLERLPLWLTLREPEDHYFVVLAIAPWGFFHWRGG